MVWCPTSAAPDRWCARSATSGPSRSAPTGRRIGSTEAVRIGLALAAVPRDELDQAVADLVDALISQPTEALRAVTRLIGSATVSTPEEQLEAEQSEQLNRLRELAAPAGRSHQAGRR